MAQVRVVTVCLGSCCDGSMRIGNGSTFCNGVRSTALGYFAHSDNHATAVGSRTDAGPNSTTVGTDAGLFCACNATALGSDARAMHYSTAVGNSASASRGATVLGRGASSCGENEIVIQSATYAGSCDAINRIRVTDDAISFRIGGCCRTIPRASFFAAFGIS